MDFTAVIDEMSDPVLALEGREIRAVNDAAQSAFAVTGELEGESVEALFCHNETLAGRYEDALAHYSDVGGVVDDGERHFDLSHPTIATLRDGRHSLPNPDLGIFEEGQLRYYHLRSSPTDIEGVEQLVICRDVTRLKGRERDLTFLEQVLTRILRHNLRNELTVVMGNAQSIEDAGDYTALAGEMVDSCASLMETSEKARLIQQTIEADEQVAFHLPRAVTKVLTAYEDDATLSADVADMTVLANPGLDEALNEIIENSIDHSGTEPDITITAERDGPWATLEITDDGPGIPERELAILEQRGETQLVHGTGAGLWLIYTVVQESGGDLTYETDGQGTTVRLQLPLANGTQQSGQV